MKKDKRQIQLRLSNQMKNELRNLAIKLSVTTADVVRGSLFYGLPVFEAMYDLQSRINRRLVKSLKTKSRKTGIRSRIQGYRNR